MGPELQPRPDGTATPAPRAACAPLPAERPRASAPSPGGTASPPAAAPVGGDALAGVLNRCVQQRAGQTQAVLQRGITKHSDRAKTAKKSNRKRHKHVDHYQEKTRASKFRFFRRLQSAYGGSRNVGMLKLVRTTGSGNRKVVYVIGRSLGLGVSKFTLGSEEVLTGTHTLKKRSHSEAVLRAVLEVGQLDVGGRRLNIGAYTPQYVASTNAACGHQHENCAVESVPLLQATSFYSANPYSGSGDASGWEKRNNKHQRKVKQARKPKSVFDYESDEESEDEYEAVVVDDTMLRGVDIGEDSPAAIGAVPFDTYLSTGDPKKVGRHTGNYGKKMKRDLNS